MTPLPAGRFPALWPRLPPWLAWRCSAAGHHVSDHSLSVAAIAGDTVNNWPDTTSARYRRSPLSQEGVSRPYAPVLHEHYGMMTILALRPIIRTFAPFVAGIGAMNYRKFITYNVVGGIVWVSLFTLSGYFFGNLEVVKKNFSLCSWRS